jgi:hypothetical protein
MFIRQVRADNHYAAWHEEPLMLTTNNSGTPTDAW